MRSLALAVLAVLALPGSAHAAGPSWVAVTVEAGPRGASLADFGLAFSAAPLGTAGRSVTGTVLLQRGAGPEVRAVAGGSDLHLRVTGAGEPVDTALSQGAGSSFATEFSTTRRLVPRERLTMIAFHTGGEVRFTGRSGAVRGRIRQRVASGTGGAVVPVADRASEGLGVVAGPVALGSSTVTRTVSKAIVGGLLGDACGADCSVGWRSPAGASAGTTGSNGELDQAAGFIGPAGAWTFTWEGTRTPLDAPDPSSPVFAFYLPVGAAAAGF